jgi:hypothetical protein
MIDIGGDIPQECVSPDAFYPGRRADLADFDSVDTHGRAKRTDVLRESDKTLGEGWFRIAHSSCQAVMAIAASIGI